MPSLHWSLQNLKGKNFYPDTVLDIGAYEGNWTKDLIEVYPAARLLMIEAQKSKTILLERIKEKFANTDYAISLFLSTDGADKYFCENETASPVSDQPVLGFPVNIIKTRSLDSLLNEKQFPLPDLLKLDVQGHEMEVLKGASAALFHASICLLEISLIDLGNSDPLL